MKNIIIFMIYDSWVILHGGYSPVTFVEYLYRVLLYLLAFTTVAMAARFCVGVVDAITGGAVAERDTKQDKC